MNHMRNINLRKPLSMAVSLAVVMGLLCSITAYAAGTGFTDVDENAYYAGPVEWAVENNITAGTGDNTFSPDAVCTRAQAVTFLWRLYGSPDVYAATAFTDVNKTDYYYNAVLWAVVNGITKGTSDTTFSPNDTVNRGQIVTFLYRASVDGYESSQANTFKDVAKGDYFYYPVLWANEVGITTGTDVNTFSPNQGCTRGQMVTFLCRMSFIVDPDDPEWDLPDYDFTSSSLKCAHADMDTINRASNDIFANSPEPGKTPAIQLVNQYFKGDTSGAQYDDNGKLCAYLFSNNNYSYPDDHLVGLIIYVDENGNFLQLGMSSELYPFIWTAPGLTTASMDYEKLMEVCNTFDTLLAHSDLDKMTAEDIIATYLGGNQSGVQYRLAGTPYAYLFTATSHDAAENVDNYVRLAVYADKDGMCAGLSWETGYTNPA